MLPVEVVLHAVRPDPLQGVDSRPGPAQRLHPVLPLKLAQGLQQAHRHLIGQHGVRFLLVKMRDQHIQYLVKGIKFCLSINLPYDCDNDGSQ